MQCFKASFCLQLKVAVDREVKRRAGPAIGKVDVSLLSGGGDGEGGGMTGEGGMFLEGGA